MLRLLLLAIFCAPSLLVAQDDYRVTASGKTVHFKEIDRLIIEGTDGSDMIISGTRNGNGDDSRATGLRKISASGLDDNTGLGVNVREEDGKLLVRQVGRKGKILVKVPNGAILKIEQSTTQGHGLEVSDFGGELNVSMLYHRVKLRNIGGPTAVNTVYDDIIAVWEQVPTTEVRLHSTYNDVDVTLPGNTAANLSLSTSYGEMFTDFDIQMKANMTKKSGGGSDDDDCNCDTSHGGLSGTINGGGKLIHLSATYNNIYLRKQ